MKGFNAGSLLSSFIGRIANDKAVRFREGVGGGVLSDSGIVVLLWGWIGWRAVEMRLSLDTTHRGFNAESFTPFFRLLDYELMCGFVSELKIVV